MNPQWNLKYMIEPIRVYRSFLKLEFNKSGYTEVSQDIMGHKWNNVNETFRNMHMFLILFL